MKAAQISGYGGPEVISVREIDKPTVGEGQVLIHVHASSINPFDSKVRMGYMKQMRPLEFPCTIGGDVAGVIEELGSGVEGLAKGDRVYGAVGVFGGGTGAMAQFAVTKAGQVAVMPKSTDFNEAAAVALVGLSAMQGLVDAAHLTSGQRILIQGGSGGVGSAAIQLAKHLGAYVITTVRGSSAEFAKQMGADEVLNFEQNDFTGSLHDLDVVFDTVGGDTFTDSFRVLKKGGVVVSMAARPNEELDRKYGVRSVGVSTQTTTEQLGRLTELIDKGVIKPQIEKTYPLAETAHAFGQFEKGNVKGKYVITVA